MTTIFGTNPYKGLRYWEEVTEFFSPVLAPNNYINAPLPDNVGINALETPNAVAACVAQKNNTYINTETWSETVYIVDDSVPLVPVTIPNPPSYKQQLAAILSDGVPIPPGIQPEPDTDRELSVYHPGRDKLWELWRANQDPTTGAWTCSDGGRMSYVSVNPGHWRSRSNGAVYPTLNDNNGNPLTPAKRDTFEVVTWGATAAKLPLLGLTMTYEDYQAGEILHALGIASDPRYIAPGKRWPAQGYDGYTALAGLQEGMRLRLPAGYQISQGLHPICQMIARCAIRYGFVVWDRAGALSFRAEPKVHATFGVPPSQVLLGFPWQDLQVIATGSDSNPNPTV